MNGNSRSTFKAFISSVITLALLEFVLTENITFIPDIAKFIIVMYLFVVFMTNITFIFVRRLNLLNILKGKMGKTSVLFENLYIEFGLLSFLVSLALIFTLVKSVVAGE